MAGDDHVTTHKDILQRVLSPTETAYAHECELPQRSLHLLKAGFLGVRRNDWLRRRECPAVASSLILSTEDAE